MKSFPFSNLLISIHGFVIFHSEFESNLEIEEVYTTANSSTDPEGIVDVTAAVGSQFRSEKIKDIKHKK